MSGKGARVFCNPISHPSNYDTTPEGGFIMLSDASVDDLEVILDFDLELEQVLPPE